MNKMDDIKILNGPLGVLMSLGYVAATAITLYFEKALGFLGLSKITISLLTILMVIDFATGIWRSHRLKVQITSTTAKEGFYEKVVSMIGLVTLALVVKLAGIPTGALINVIMTIGSLIEAYSIFGNLIAIRTRKEITEQDALTFALLTARKKLWNWIKYLAQKGEPGNGDI